MPLSRRQPCLRPCDGFADGQAGPSSVRFAATFSHREKEDIVANMTANRVTPRARSLRQSGGLAEDRVWARLRGGAIDGWKVRRQHPVGRFVVDFACIPLRLVLEIDGGVHGRDEAVLNDHLRQQEIEALGWTVVRFTNAQVLAEPWRLDDALRDRARTLGL